LSAISYQLSAISYQTHYLHEPANIPYYPYQYLYQSADALGSACALRCIPSFVTLKLLPQLT
ncbi:hypothetical protein, partial [Pseudoalteromonas sp. SG43-8]|uniref:hypothetical protein n=1 Tax=Pseudoalteromonas sp. SG43-8 TaxID=2760965 RepID=UPI001C71C877